MATENKREDIDSGEDILLSFGKRTLAILGMLLIPLLTNQLDPPWTVLVITTSLVLWALIKLVLLVRGRRSGASGLFLRSAVFTSLMALEVNEESSKVWLYGGDNGSSPSPLTHLGFHAFINAGIETSLVLFLLLLAWFPLRKGQLWAVMALGMAGSPTALTAAYATTVALVLQRDYGYAHPYVWLLTLFWLLGVLSAVGGVLLQKRSRISEAPIS